MSGVYVHVPFCRRRCSYCDFYFEIGASPAGFADAVVAELAARRGEISWPASTLSFGGGTPSQLGVADLGRIVEAVRTLGLVDGAEIALEVNPEDVSADLARGLRDVGFTRASVGLQSLDDSVLRWLGRAHDGAGGAGAVRALVDAGLATGVDLIVGVPDEPAGRVDDDLARVVALGAAHVSAYVLTVEPQTPLVRLIARGRRRSIDDDAQAAAYERVQERAPLHGLRQYEISSWARPGHESRHNRLYWQRGAYLGLGPGAHSFRVDESGRAVRRHTTARLAAWLPAPTQAAVDVESLGPRHALRQTLAAAVGRGHVVVRSPGPDEGGGDEERYHLTSIGVRFADAVARDVLAAADDDERDA